MMYLLQKNFLSELLFFWRKRKVTKENIAATAIFAFNIS